MYLLTIRIYQKIRKFTHAYAEVRRWMKVIDHRLKRGKSLCRLGAYNDPERVVNVEFGSRDELLPLRGLVIFTDLLTQYRLIYTMRMTFPILYSLVPEWITRD